jgi:hypothetical protein
MTPLVPRSMKSEQVRAGRLAMLTPHIEPPARFAAELRARHGVEVPDFDPLDGGKLRSALRSSGRHEVTCPGHRCQSDHRKDRLRSERCSAALNPAHQNHTTH